MTTSDQLPLPDMPTPPSGMAADEIGAMATRIATNAAEYPVEVEPDATDAWLDDSGGGGRRESLAVDPPRQGRPDKRPVSPRAGMARETARGEDHKTYGDEFGQNGREHLDRDQIARNRAGRVLVMAALAKLRSEAPRAEEKPVEGKSSVVTMSHPAVSSALIRNKTSRSRPKH